MEISNAVCTDETYGAYANDECFHIHDYEDDTDRDAHDDTGDDKMMILMMILMMVGAGTCILSKLLGGKFVYLKSALGLNLWPEQRI